MDVIGNGFVAKALRPLRGVHPGVVALASGVSLPHETEAGYRRERALVEDTARRCRKAGATLVFFSSAAVYGGPGCAGREDDPASPPTRYGRHKLELERLLRASGVRHLSLRLGYALGRHAPGHRLVPSLVRQVRAGHVTVQRNTSRDLIHAGDVTRIVDALLAVGVLDEVVNVASGRCVPVDRIVDHVERRLGTRAERHVVDGPPTTCPSLQKLRALVPPGFDLDFPATYYRSVIDAYLVDTGTIPGPGRADRAGRT